MASRTDTILAIIATDRTFERVERGGEELWEGRCIFCRRRLEITLSGKPISRATVEHIVPRSQGGTDDLRNLAIACSGCNHEKGRRHDRARRPSPRAREIQERLLERRRERWRDG